MIAISKTPRIHPPRRHKGTLRPAVSTAAIRPSVPLTNVIARYRAALRVCKSARGEELRPSTQTDYYHRVKRYIKTLGEGATTANLNRADVRSYLIALAERTTNAHSDRCALQHWEAWLRSEDLIGTELVGDIKLKRQKQGIRKPVPDDTLRRLFNAADQLNGERRRLRARALLSVLTYAALRRFEVTALTVSDIDFKDRRIDVRDGKGGKARSVHPCSDCLADLATWLKARPRSDHDALFTRGQLPMSYAGIYSTLKAVKVLAGLADVKITPHMFRHSSATRDANANVPLPVIQAKLGHSNITTTARYLHANERAQIEYAERNSLQTTRKPTKPVPAVGRRRIALRAA